MGSMFSALRMSRRPSRQSHPRHPLRVAPPIHQIEEVASPFETTTSHSWFFSGLRSLFPQSFDLPQASPRDPNPPTANMKSTLYKLPTELREMVFKYSLSPEWDGKMPDLIKALRSDKNLYTECIHAWRKHKHTYILSEKNDWSFLDMPKNVIATITKVRIMVDEDIALHPLLRWSDMAVIHERLPMSIHNLSLTAALATSVTSVTLDCRPKTFNLYFWYPSRFTLYLSGFPVLTYVETTCPIKPNSPVHEGGGGRGMRDEEAMVDSAWQELTMKKAVRAGNMELGVVAKLKMVYADEYWDGARLFRKFEDRDAWIWVAEEGKTLNKIYLPPGLMMTGPRKRSGLFH